MDMLKRTLSVAVIGLVSAAVAMQVDRLVGGWEGHGWALVICAFAVFMIHEVDK